MAEWIWRKMEVQSGLENLKGVRQFVAQAVLDSGMPQNQVNQIVLAVDEAVANIMRHGYKQQPEGTIEIEVGWNREKIQIVVADYSPGFDLHLVENPDLQKHVAEGKRSGLGIYLMRKIMDQISYQRGEKNVLTLTKFFPPPQKEESTDKQ